MNRVTFRPSENNDRSTGQAGMTFVLDLGSFVDELADRIAERLAATESNTGRAWLDVREAAEHLSCSPERLRKLVQRRAVPFHQERRGGRLFFNRSELDAWLLSQ